MILPGQGLSHWHDQVTAALWAPPGPRILRKGMRQINLIWTARAEPANSGV
jgi:hypothetical protein